MYILFGIIFAICILFFIINFFRRRHTIKKVRCMDYCEKIELLNNLIKPFGFSYCASEDIITSEIDAWQKIFGYCYLYDKSAPLFNMVFDCEPIYFNYEDKTWMIEFWKGQYGINIGGEIGIYHADTIISPDQYNRALFHGVSDNEMLSVSMELNFKGQNLFSIYRTHWWLTGFAMGSYCEPEDVSMDICITFPNEEMLKCFTESMKRKGYNECDLYILSNSVSFSFSIPHTHQPRIVCRRRSRYSQWKNRIFCKIYKLVTKPFICTLDQILYLYFFLPASFRHLLRFKRSRRHKRSKKNKARK